jgi:hypothetical protein
LSELSHIVCENITEWICFGRNSLISSDHGSQTPAAAPANNVQGNNTSICDLKLAYSNLYLIVQLFNNNSDFEAKAKEGMNTLEQTFPNLVDQFKTDCINSKPVKSMPILKRIADTWSKLQRVGCNAMVHCKRIFKFTIDQKVIVMFGTIVVSFILLKQVF